MGGRILLVEIDGLATEMRCRDGQVTCSRRNGSPVHVVCRSTGRTLLELLDGEQKLLDAILSDRLLLQGALGDLLAVHEGLLSYVRGAVRSPSVPTLLGDFRRTVSRSAPLRALSPMQVENPPG